MTETTAISNQRTSENTERDTACSSIFVTTGYETQTRDIRTSAPTKRAASFFLKKKLCQVQEIEDVCKQLFYTEKTFKVLCVEPSDRYIFSTGAHKGTVNPLLSPPSQISPPPL